MKILFIGESWLGSCARSLCESIARSQGLEVFQIHEDSYFVKGDGFVSKVVNRLLYGRRKARFERDVLERIGQMRPDAVICYKGYHVHKGLIERIKSAGCLTVNVYPDYSPHAHGRNHKLAVGAYDLVVSSKVFHPGKWMNTYGYTNECLFVPQGYDPQLHLVEAPPVSFQYDVGLVGTYRPEYGQMMLELAEYLSDMPVSVVVGGNSWSGVRQLYPANWDFVGTVSGEAYLKTLRSARICIAPIITKVNIDGKVQPGDVDTTRTYELAAAHCFFIHRRTDYVRGLYDESTEVPMFDDARELAEKIRYYLDRESERREMAAATHRRAVPAYSIDARSAEIMQIIRDRIARKACKAPTDAITPNRDSASQPNSILESENR